MADELLRDRQDLSEARQDIADARTTVVEEVQQKATDVFSVILGTLSRLDSGQHRLEEKIDRQTERMDVLVDTTNHRLDDFRLIMDSQAVEFRTAIRNKVDKTDLLTSVGFKLGNMKVVRWGLGILFAAIVGTTAVQMWWVDVLNLFGG